MLLIQLAPFFFLHFSLKIDLNIAFVDEFSLQLTSEKNKTILRSTFFLL